MRGFSGRVACWLLCLGAPLAVAAAEGQFALIGGVGTSDNVGRTVEDEQSETIASIGAQFGLLQESRRLSVNLNGDLAWLKYFDDSFDPELVGSAGADMLLNVVDGFLSWSVLERYGQTRTDLLAAASPANREDYNFFSTGPDITVRLGSGTRLVAMGRYSRVDYGAGLFDSQRYSQALALQRDLASGATLSLLAATQKIDPEAAPIFDQSEAVIGYTVSGARTSLLLQVGGSRVESSGGSDSGEVLRVNLSRQVGERSTLTMRGGRETVDAGGSLAGWTGDGLPPATDDASDLSRSNSPFVADSIELGWRIQGRATTVELGANWIREESTDPATPSRRRKEAHVGASRQLGPRLRSAIDLRHSDRDVAGLGGSTEDSAAVRLDLRAGRSIFIGSSAELSRFRRDGQPGTAREHRFWLTLRYENARD